MSLTGARRCIRKCIAFAIIALFASGCHKTVNRVERELQFTEIRSPSGPGASVPSLSVGGHDKLYMVWVEPALTT
jgi:hypothetical protein